ncbi:MAG TPA: hypothetical protein PLA74_08960 [Syntrophales bacterium]|nr:hypothetical protein [Syntrophales bacterium]HPQ44427.1 hypothetical protein [Syntrophales bacterium]
MIIVTTVLFNEENVCETNKHSIGLPPVPDYIHMMGPYITNVTLGGDIQVVNLFEFEESRLDEAREFITDRMAAYHRLINMTYSVDLWFDAEDAKKMVDDQIEKTCLRR